MDKVTASRTQLLALRARIEFAERSRDLLEDKRNELLKEYRKAADNVLAGGDALEHNAAEARRVLADVAADEGPESVRTAAVAAQAEVDVSRIMNIIRACMAADRASRISNRRRGWSPADRMRRVSFIMIGPRRFRAAVFVWFCSAALGQGSPQSDTTRRNR